MKQYLPSWLILFLLVLIASSISPAHAACVAQGQFASLCDIKIDDHTTLFRTIVQIFFSIAGIASLFFLLYGGVKWILSGGDKTKIGEARGMLTAAIVGFILTFSSFFILNIVSGFFGLRVGTIFVIPRLTNEVPLPPTDVTNVAPPCENQDGC